MIHVTRRRPLRQRPLRQRITFTGGIVLAAGLLAAMTAACGSASAPAPHTSAPHTSAPHTSATAPAPSRSPAPPAALQQAGPGWALAEFTTGSETTPGPVTLYLVDPAGGTHEVYRWPASSNPWQLIDWSGDKTRALFQESTSSTMHELNLATGRVTTFAAPAGTVLGYTRPDGENFLVWDAAGLARYSLTGVLQQRLMAGAQYEPVVSSADGQTEVVAADTGVRLISNTGGVIRELRVPGATWCRPQRWWDPQTVLASCQSGGSSYRVWLVPVSGAVPQALTPARAGSGADKADFDAWQLPTGTYVQAAAECGTQFVGRQNADGTVTKVSVPGASGVDNVVRAVSGGRMLIRQTSCSPGGSLFWLDPASGLVQPVLTAPASSLGVLGLAVYNRDCDQPFLL